MDLKLRDKVVVITGASRGIGRAIAHGFAAEGAHLAICSRGEPTLETTAKELEATGVRVYARACDVADASALSAFLDGAVTEFGGVDVLVNNASGFGVADTDEHWQLGFDIDVLASVRASRQLTPVLQRRGGGVILFISSTAALEAPGPWSYSAMKAALISYSKNLAIALAPNNVRVNVVAPGSIEFPGGVWEQTKQSAPEQYEAIRSTIPFGRLGTAEEVADTVVFLASERARWVTGAVLSVDGGQHKGNL